MFHRFFYRFINIENTDTKNGSIQFSVYGFCPDIVYAGETFSDTDDGTDSCAVTVRIVTDFDRAADGFAEITLSVKQSENDDGGIGDGMRPAVRVCGIIFRFKFFNRFG